MFIYSSRYAERKLAKGEKLEEEVKIAPPKPISRPSAPPAVALEIEPIERRIRDEYALCPELQRH